MPPRIVAVARRDQGYAIVHDQEDRHAGPPGIVHCGQLHRHEPQIDRARGEERQPGPGGERPTQGRSDERVRVGGASREMEADALAMSRDSNWRTDRPESISTSVGVPGTEMLSSSRVSRSTASPWLFEIRASSAGGDSGR